MKNKKNGDSPNFSKKFKYFTSLVCGFLILIISIYGFVLLRHRTGLPLEINIQDLVQIDGIQIQNEKDVEFIMSQKRIGEYATFLLETEGKLEKKEVKLIPFYSQAPFPLIYLIIGLFCFTIGFLVFILRSEEGRARIFYWTALAFSFSLIISGGFYCLREESLSYIPEVLYNIFYPLCPALFLHFSLSFSQRISKRSKLIIYTPALLFAAVLETTYLLSSLKSSIEIFRIYHSVIYVFRFYIIVFVLLAIFHLIISFRRASLDVPRAQIKWILYGLFVGLGPFIFLYQLPLIIKMSPIISEEFSAIFFIFLPISFAFSIIKFKLMNIELLINRSLVYGALTIFTVSLYLFSVYVFQNLFLKFFHVQKAAISVIAALTAAAAFHPARKKFQEFVDKSFYRLSYDYRKTIFSFNEKVQKMIKQDQLIDFFLIKIKKVLPLEHMGISIYSTASGRRKLLIKGGEERDINSIVPICLKSNQILARKKASRTEENIDFTKENFLEERGIELIIPLSFRSAALSGFLTLGKKMSGERFTRDDLELLLTLAGELALNFERIKLQEEVIYERAEKEKLDELSHLKTEFISTVSHELRTPMSSIRGLTEILQEGKIKEKAKQDELLSLVASESNRLSRLLHNILDFGRIEQKLKTYNFQKAEIQSIIEEVVKLFRYRLERDGFLLRVNLPKNPLFLEIDQDALKQALTNLIDNAIKYSSDKKDIDIKLVEMENQVVIQVRDKGIGIPLDVQEKIFERFYRHPDATQHEPKGVGLGLKIVRHIMNAHKGEIRVKSQPNKGSTFSLIFPKP